MIYSESPDVIRIAGCIPDSAVDGPGVRYTLFFQGCHHNCFGCHNLSTHSWDDGDFEDVPVEIIVENFKATAAANRITISGGEPFCQPQALLTLVKTFAVEGVKDIWLYTGYELSELTSDVQREILTYVSSLVTGRFVISETEGAQLFTGSANQQVHRLRDV